MLQALNVKKEITVICFCSIYTKPILPISEFPNCVGAIDCTHMPVRPPKENLDQFKNRDGYFSLNVNVTGQQPLKLAHSPLGYAVGKLILIGLDGQSLGSRHTEINFNKIYFPRKQLKIHYHFLTICL